MTIGRRPAGTAGRVDIGCSFAPADAAAGSAGQRPCCAVNCYHRVTNRSSRCDRLHLHPIPEAGPPRFADVEIRRCSAYAIARRRPLRWAEPNRGVRTAILVPRRDLQRMLSTDPLFDDLAFNLGLSFPLDK